MKMDDITLSKAYYIWQNAYKFDNRIYEIMQFIVKREQPKILINRNPTLNYYSILLMSVRKVKKDINDYTLSVPLSVLPGLNADFDGKINCRFFHNCWELSLGYWYSNRVKIQ